MTREVTWHWSTRDDLPRPYHEIFCGALAWSLDRLVAAHASYLLWTKEVFDDPDPVYDAVWYGKLALADVPNGDLLALDLGPVRHGAVVYLSHDDGEGHGFVLADSLGDLLDRWVPLACPGPEDGQWLPFVPVDRGPIDPAGEAGLAWRALLGLEAAAPTTPAGRLDDDLFDALLVAHRTAPTALERHESARRALRVCTVARAGAVADLLASSDDPYVQEEAAALLGRWRWTPGVPVLQAAVEHGTHNGRLAAQRALDAMGPQRVRDT